MQNYIIITNNPLTARNAASNNVLRYYEGVDILSILTIVRANIHEGHKLATHPLTSSIKPNETPYKTVLMYSRKGSLCVESLEMVESAIRVTEKFVQRQPPRSWDSMPQKILDDLAIIDYDMIKQWIT
ncbi:MAG: GrdX family protein [Defluviitaleaceae bacterium]|nr:GrdX family protein [Defluviitaleaceae bacterium]